VQAGGGLQLHQLVVGLGVARLGRSDALLIGIPISGLAALAGAGAQARLGLAVAGCPATPTHIHINRPAAIRVSFGVQIEADGHSCSKTLCLTQRVVVGGNTSVYLAVAAGPV
jgi:hypothetical protein